MRKKGESGFERRGSEESNRRKRKKGRKDFSSRFRRIWTWEQSTRTDVDPLQSEDPAIPNGTADHHLLNAIEAEANPRAEPDVWGADES